MEHHPYRLRPYHNPDNVDESKVPAGWRFRYADEMFTRHRRARFFGPLSNIWRASMSGGTLIDNTYIVPVVA